MIGHNNPPPAEAFGLHIEELFALASCSLAAGPVATDEQEAALDKLMDDLRKARKDADAQRDAEKRPHDEAAKAVQSTWKPLLDRCDAGVRAIKDALTPYRAAKQRAKDEAAAQARTEAQAKLEAAQAALRTSDDLEGKFAAEAELKQASKLQAVANRIDREATGLRTQWQAEVTDRRAALLHYINVNPAAFENLLQELADRDARGARAPIPGVNFIELKIAT